MKLIILSSAHPLLLSSLLLIISVASSYSRGHHGAARLWTRPGLAAWKGLIANSKYEVPDRSKPIFDMKFRKDPNGPYAVENSLPEYASPLRWSSLQSFPLMRILPKKTWQPPPGSIKFLEGYGQVNTYHQHTPSRDKLNKNNDEDPFQDPWFKRNNGGPSAAGASKRQGAKKKGDDRKYWDKKIQKIDTLKFKDPADEDYYSGDEQEVTPPSEYIYDDEFTAVTKVPEVAPTTEAPTGEVPNTKAPSTEAPTAEVPNDKAPSTEVLNLNTELKRPEIMSLEIKERVVQKDMVDIAD